MFITFYSSTGISNATNFNFTLPAPENNTVGGFVVYPAEVYDNNSWQNTVGVVGISASEARVGISNSTQSANAYGGFTASSNKAVHVGLSYPL